MRPRREPDLAAMLARALVTTARDAGCAVALSKARSRSWSSATFAGERVELAMLCDGPVEPWLSTLVDTDLPVRGCYVADLAVKGSGDREVRLEALLLRES